MESPNQETKGSKIKPCFCTAILGVLVIVFAWWKVGWAAIALTVLGILIIIKTFVPCCCSGMTCKPK